jgi:hypothetical protein
MSKYIILFVSLLSFDSIYSQSIYYTDINPDTSIVVSSGLPVNYDLDLNADGFADFRFSVSALANSFGAQSLSSVTALDSNFVIGEVNSGNWAFEMNFSDTINANSSYIDNWGIFRKNYGLFNGYWSNYGTPAYLGVKFYGNSVWYYGWIKLNVEVAISHCKITIYEYAYSILPIYAGEGSPLIGLNESDTVSSIKSFPNPSSGFIYLQSDMSNLGKQYSIFDHLGKLISSGLLTDEKTTLDLNVPSGVYIIKTGTISKKIIINKTNP